MPESSIVVAVTDPVRRARIAAALSLSDYGVLEAPNAATALNLAPRAHLLLISLGSAQMEPVIRRLRADPSTAALPILRLDDTPGEGVETDVVHLTHDVPITALAAVVRAMLRAERAEERVRTLARQWRSTFDAIRDGICLVDLSGRVLRCNVALATMVGKPIPDLIGRDSSELFKGWSAQEGAAGDGLARVKASRKRETDLVRRDARYFSHVVDPVFDEEGSLAGAVRIVSEVTDRKRLEDELRERAEELSRANRTKDEFLATVSHELRTPLHSMMGWIGLLRGGQLTRTLRGRALETIERNTQAQARLVEDLLDMSRIITGKLRLETRPLDLASSIQAAIDSLKPTAEAKGVRVHFTSHRPAARILGDPDRLQQIVWNLLSNAIKFTPAGTADPRIEIGLEHDDTHARLTVTDHGAGIDAEFLPYVFDRFRQADGTTTRRHGGLGLGLAIVRHLVELHGGTVQVESGGRGTGASFCLSFPLLTHVSREAEAG